MSTDKNFTLVSLDGETFDVDEAVVLKFLYIKDYVENDCGVGNNKIPASGVTGKILAKVIEYCKKHVENPKGDDPSADDELKNWDAEFVKVNVAILHQIAGAAHYLAYTQLEDFIVQAFIGLLADKTLLEIRETFGLSTQDKEEVRRVEVRREN